MNENEFEVWAEKMDAAIEVVTLFNTTAAENMMDGGATTSLYIAAAEFLKKQFLVQPNVPKDVCKHDRLNEDGICRSCGKDCRGIG